MDSGEIGQVLLKTKNNEHALVPGDPIDYNDKQNGYISMNVKDYSTGVSTNQTINLGQGLNNFIIDLIKRAIK